MASSVFPTATQARYNPVREFTLHEEARGIEHLILIASSDGFYNTVVNNGTPMTNSVTITNELWSVDTVNNDLIVPNHGLSNGDTVTVFSNGTLPSPLQTNTYYYVIYIDPNTIKLANSFINARLCRPMSLQFTNAVNSLTLSNPGSGYLVAPNVSIVGGNATVTATATATLAEYGDLINVSLINPGSYASPPSLTVTPQGIGATAANVSFSLVSVVINNGGQNYRVGDILSIVGGTGSVASVAVSTIGLNGTVLTATVSNTGLYIVLPSLTGVTTTATPGGGSGCTLNLNMGIGAINLSSGGFGYIAPPVILISGGGGAGASAIATLNAGAVNSALLINPGSGYTSQPTITFTSGQSANVVAVLSPTSISSINLISNGGNTYISAPTVSIITAGSGAILGSVVMQVVAATIVNTGSNYLPGDLLQVAGGGGTSSCTIQVLTIAGSGQISTYVVTSGGSYTLLPASLNLVNGGSGSGATFNLNYGLQTIPLLNGGNNYISSPVVQISGPGYGATAIAPVVSGSIVNIIVQSSGMSFTTIPTIALSAGDSATAIANLTPTSVANINVTNTGSGYTTATVNITGGATANAIISNGNITGYTITFNGGNIYTTAPNVTITGNGTGATAYAVLKPTNIASLTLTNSGENFTGIPNVVITGSATANVTLTPTGIARVDILNGGNYFNAAPFIYASNSLGNDATFNAQIGYALSSLNIINAGVNYTTVPNVVISSPAISTGIPATGIANIGAGYGTFALQQYNESLDYYSVWQNNIPSNPDLARPYSDQMSTIINYFTQLGYTINQQTNPVTGNTFQWSIKW